MKILFSPAETKKSGGIDGKITRESFLFPELFSYRNEVLEKYQNYINAASDEQLSKFFGIKDYSKFEKYKRGLDNQALMKVIQRYDGVAFDYLEYDSLDASAQAYIDKNTVIFSNLYGPLLAGDFGIAEYRLKQGEKIDGFAAETFYKKHFSDALDTLLKEEPYLDLRAGFYNKFYKPSSEYVTLKFLKNDKVVSHWAKAYRGLVLKAMAQNRIESFDAFKKMEIENLSVNAIVQKGIHTEIIFDIIK